MGVRVEVGFGVGVGVSVNVGVEVGVYVPVGVGVNVPVGVGEAVGVADACTMVPNISPLRCENLRITIWCSPSVGDGGVVFSFLL